MISKELAEILGLLCSEGCYVRSRSSYWGVDGGKLRFHKDKITKSIQFYNKDQKLLLHFQKLILHEFNYLVKITKYNKIYLCRRKVIAAILDKTKLGHLRWSVNHDLFENKECAIAFIRGYFDGDGTASKYPRLFSTNHFGLIQVSKLLAIIGFSSNFQKPLLKINRKPLFTLRIHDGKRFLKTISPISKIQVPMRG